MALDLSPGDHRLNIELLLSWFGRSKNYFNSICSLVFPSLKCRYYNIHPSDVLRAKKSQLFCPQKGLVACFQASGKKYTVLPTCAEAEKVHI